MSESEPIYVTGTGCVSPLGCSVSSFWDGLLDKQSGIQHVPRLREADRRVTYAGYAEDFDPTSWLPESELKNLSRSAPMLISSATQALQEAGLSDLTTPDQTGVVIGSGGGSSDFTERQYDWYFTGNGSPSIYNVSSSTDGNLASELSMHLDARGPCHLISTGCTSSSDAFGHALMLLRAGHAEAVICGGVDTPVMPGIMKGFETMRVLADGYEENPREACRPFDAERSGMVLGEGCWLTVLETESHLENRSGPGPMAELTGYASNCSAHDRVRLEEKGTNGIRTMREALERTGWSPESVQYIHLHGTGTELNDRVETNIIKEVFKDPPPAGSLKQAIGHPQGASGAAGMVAAVRVLVTDTVPPVRNHHDPDPPESKRFIPTAPVTTELDRVLVNCLGFGSRSSVLTLATV